MLRNDSFVLNVNWLASKLSNQSSSSTTYLLKYTTVAPVKQIPRKNYHDFKNLFFTPVNEAYPRKPFMEQFSPHFSINNENACNKTVDILVGIHSNPSHWQLRDIIRRTWSNQTYWPNHRIKTLFFVGIPSESTQNNITAQELLTLESQLYNDIVQIDFLDTYRNLTLKAVSVLNWLKLYCAKSTYFLKADDDVIVNIFTFQRRYLNKNGYPVSRRQIVCLALRRNEVPRKGKHAVTEEELSSDFFPPFCAGMGYLTQTSTALAMLAYVPAEPLFWIDDVYVTGFLGRRAKVVLRPIRGTYNDTDTIIAFTDKRWRNFGFGHMKNTSLIEGIWRKMVDAAAKISKTQIKGLS